MSGSETTTHPDAPEVPELDDIASAQELAERPSAPAQELPFSPARASTWRDGVTGQLEAVWQGLRAHDNSRHRPVHAAPHDERAERIAAAGMGLLVLVGAVVTYLAVVGAIDPLLAPAPAGGAPPAVVGTVTPSRTATTPATEPAGQGASTEPTAPRTRSRGTATGTSRQSAPTPTPTPTTSPPAAGPTPSPTPSPSG